MTAKQAHATVLRDEAVAALAVTPAGIYIDATFGRGGHARAILDALGPEGIVLALDRDPQAIEEARRLQGEDARLRYAYSAFSELAGVAGEQNIEEGQVDGLLFDLGVSSPQLDEAERGFSFLRDGPLGMRMDPGKGRSAAQWINTAKAEEIADVLFHYGEERHSRRMARALVAEREKQAITTTGQLAEIIKQANPAWEKDKHPATRAFQAIRIFINDELEELKQGLNQALGLLKPKGRLVVISFHSLEDRIVKKFIAKQTKGDNFPRDLPIPDSMLSPTLKTIGKATKASAEEVRINPRARSAIMRVAEKI